MGVRVVLASWLSKISIILRRSHSFPPVNRAMGCCQASPIPTAANPEPHEVKAEESHYCANEYSLQYYNSPAAKIAETIRAHSPPEGKINVRDFNALAQELRLNVREMDTLDSTVYSFYRYFRDGRNFDRDKLVILGAVLGAGSAKEKLKVAWSTLPGAQEDHVAASALHWLLDILFSLAGEYLPVLTRNDPYADNQELNLAIQSFQRSKPKAISLCLTRFVQSRAYLSLSEAESALDSDPYIGRLWRSDGLRSILAECKEG